MTARQVVDQIRALARLHGWGIGEHGSMVRDIDLIAVPWTEDASPLQVLLSAIMQVCGREQFHGVAQKPLGRIGYLLQVPGTEHVGSYGFKTRWEPPMVDLSLVDPRLYVAPEPAPSNIEQPAFAYTHEGD